MSDKIVELNVGGTPYTTKMSTLLKSENGSSVLRQLLEEGARDSQVSISTGRIEGVGPPDPCWGFTYLGSHRAPVHDSYQRRRNFSELTNCPEELPESENWKICPLVGQDKVGARILPSEVG